MPIVNTNTVQFLQKNIQQIKRSQKAHLRAATFLHLVAGAIQRRAVGVSDESEHPLLSRLYQSAAQSLVGDVIDHVTLQLRHFGISRLVSNQPVINSACPRPVASCNRLLHNSVTTTAAPSAECKLNVDVDDRQTDRQKDIVIA